MKEYVIDKKIIRLYKAEGENLPVVYSNDYTESGTAVLDECRKLGCREFNYVTLSGINWGADMSPWSAASAVNKSDRFTGEASEHLEWMLREVVPAADDAFGTAGRAYISGYSMAGLFSLWSLYQTDIFGGCICASGSLWFDGFLEFAKKEPIKSAADCIYLSLGDRESRIANPVLQKTQSIFEKLNSCYRSQGINSVFELNRGNHFMHPEMRVAKGIKWVLEAEHGRSVDW